MCNLNSQVKLNRSPLETILKVQRHSESFCNVFLEKKQAPEQNNEIWKYNLMYQNIPDGNYGSSLLRTKFVKVKP